MDIVFATHNEHKVEEVEQLLRDLQVNVQSLGAINWQEEIIENGATMIENAWIKTNTVYDRIGGNIMADDSGLEVFALNGKPGVYSARFAGTHKNDLDNLKKVLEMMEVEQDRRAQFRAVLACIINGGRYTFEGLVKGVIIDAPRGSGGFGYDPIFIPEGYDQTFAELPQGIKNEISHRAKAFQSLKKLLVKIIG